LIQVDTLGYTPTVRRHSDLFRAATSASSHVIPILNKSVLTVLLQFIRGRPGLLLNPGTSQCNACRGMRWKRLVIHSYHLSKPAESSFAEYVMHTVLSSSDSDLFVR